MKSVLSFLAVIITCSLVFGQKIVIIDIGYHNRIEVGTALSIVSNHHPKIIGINILYTNDSSELDTVLMHSIRKANNLVMAAALHNLDAPYPFWDSLELSNDKFRAKYIGFSNIIVEDDLAIPEIPIQESYKGKLLPSFSYEIARRSGSRFQSMNATSIKVDKSKLGSHYPMLLLTEILEGKFNKADIENGIILFGFSGQEFKIKGRSKKTISGVQLQACFIDYLIKNYSN